MFRPFSVPLRTTPIHSAFNCPPKIWNHQINQGLADVRSQIFFIDVRCTKGKKKKKKRSSGIIDTAVSGLILLSPVIAK